jgi:hypothetical protein
MCYSIEQGISELVYLYFELPLFEDMWMLLSGKLASSDSIIVP